MWRAGHTTRVERLSNVTLSSYCRHSWHDQVILSKDAKQAFKGRQSIDYRLKFISDILGVARNSSITLFMPELVNSSIVEVGDQLREEVRNPVSHSAPGSEPYVRSLVERHLPSVERLLESLRFLSNYTLCRIRGHYYENGQWHYQAEVHRGAEYDINIKEESSTALLSDTSEEPQLIMAERDHLVILSADDETLDLYPFYQLYFGNETCRESHICFFKHRQSNRLFGESIRSGVEVELPGTDEFQLLTGISTTNDSQDN